MPIDVGPFVLDKKLKVVSEGPKLLGELKARKVHAGFYGVLMVCELCCVVLYMTHIYLLCYRAYTEAV